MDQLAEQNPPHPISVPARTGLVAHAGVHGPVPTMGRRALMVGRDTQSERLMVLGRWRWQGSRHLLPHLNPFRRSEDPFFFHLINQDNSTFLPEPLGKLTITRTTSSTPIDGAPSMNQALHSPLHPLPDLSESTQW